MPRYNCLIECAPRARVPIDRLMFEECDPEDVLGEHRIAVDAGSVVAAEEAALERFRSDWPLTDAEWRRVSVEVGVTSVVGTA